MMIKQKRIKHSKPEDQYVQWPWREHDAPRKMEVFQVDWNAGVMGRGGSG